jgi:hypothetical protein
MADRDRSDGQQRTGGRVFSRVPYGLRCTNGGLGEWAGWVECKLHEHAAAALFLLCGAALLFRLGLLNDAQQIVECLVDILLGLG